MSTTHITANAMLGLLQAQTLYIGLLRATPDKLGAGGNEVDTASYQRQPITFTTPNNSLMSNNAVINFPQAAESWGVVTGFALFDAVTGGNMKWFGDFPTSATLSIGSFFFMSAGGLSLGIGL